MQQPMDIDQVFSEAHLRSYSKGQIMLYQGEKTQQVFQIRKGYVKVYDITSHGSEKLVLILGENDIFPLVWTFRKSDTVRYFYETLDDAEICVIDRATMISGIRKSHELTVHLLEYFADRTSELMYRIDCIEASSAKHKVAQVLMYLANSHGEEIANCTYNIRIPMTHQSVADMAGINRTTASLQLNELEDEKIYKDTKSGFVIHTDRILKFLEN